MKLWRKLSFSIYVLFHWSISQFFMLFKAREKPIHILFCMVDHFEPGTQDATIEVEMERMQLLAKKYPIIAAKHKDGFNNIPKRTWFFPPHYHRNYNLKKLVALCEKGYGEIELHLHHGKQRPDTSENLEKTLKRCVEEYSIFGIFGSAETEKKYAFIHGDWALDNSRNNEYCGVNNEIQILNKTGCFADFTFPSLCEANPKQINSIYYVTDNPNKPKSHNKGIQVSKGGKKSGDLMIIQGPLHPFFFSDKFTSLRTPNDAINGKPPVTEKRIDFWVKTGIHIKRKRDWIIIKTHTHGATDSDAVLGDEIESIFTYLETKYNDGKNYILHYVTARELYNIIKAVEADENCTDPEKYRDFLIQPPSYDSKPDISAASDILKGYIAQTYTN